MYLEWGPKSHSSQWPWVSQQPKWIRSLWPCLDPLHRWQVSCIMTVNALCRNQGLWTGQQRAWWGPSTVESKWRIRPVKSMMCEMLFLTPRLHLAPQPRGFSKEKIFWNRYYYHFTKLQYCVLKMSHKSTAGFTCWKKQLCCEKAGNWNTFQELRGSGPLPRLWPTWKGRRSGVRAPSPWHHWRQAGGSLVRWKRSTTEIKQNLRISKSSQAETAEKKLGASGLLSDPRPTHRP